MTAARSCRPYGDAVTSDLWFIGHDPRLTNSAAEAEICFFLNLLEGPPTGTPGEDAKRALAQSVLHYVERLAGRPVRTPDLYVTNLCNEFLPPTEKGTVLIPNDAADRGLLAITDALPARGQSPRVLVPSSQQVLYHMIRGGFLAEHPDLATFAAASKPKEGPSREGRYEPTGREAFLGVCGRVFDGHGIPVVPVLHVKAWTRPSRSPRYDQPMKMAAAAVKRLLV